MAAPSNGRAKKPGKKPMANGHANGHAEKHKGNTSSAIVPSKPTRSSKKSFTGTLTNVVGRLVSWYLIITLLFRCPTSITKLSASSPRVCKPYLHTRAYAAPYLDPYYHTYVAPQLEKVQPYVDRFDQQFYSPVSTFAKDKYATYGAHRVDQAQKYAEAEWARRVQPQIQNLQSQAQAQYNQHLGPYVDKASDAVSPLYEQTKENLAEMYHLSILPAYKAGLPYARQGYAHGHHVVSRIIFPRILMAKDLTWKFISRTVWPQVRVLYGDNVEPQLVRIQERLGRYKDQQKMESAMEAVESERTSFSESITSSPASVSSSVEASASATPESGWKVLDDFFGDSSETETASTSTRSKRPQPTGKELREQLNNDLRNWQSKFATAADKGAEDLEVRVAELTKRQVDNGVNGHGAALLVQLEESAESAIAALKKFIIKTVKSLPEEATEEDLTKAFDQASLKTRELGLKIKERAEAVRKWKLSYDQETDNLVKAAVASSVEVLEKIHGLGLQEVGMRWAWLDGVTYDDWQKYHKLRTTLEEWQEEVEAVGTRHEGLKVAHDEAAKLEEKAMNSVTTSVNELVRLKDVAKWKIWAKDSTDDFSSKKVPVKVFNAAQQAAQSAQDLSSKASEAILGSETPASESLASAVSNSASSVSSKLSESIIGTETPIAESVASAISESVSAASSKASEAVVGSETPAHESIASQVKDSASSASSKASEAIAEAVSSASSGASVASEGIDAAQETVKEAASGVADAPKKVFGGVNAQSIPKARQPILDDLIEDDDETYSAKLQSLFAGAGDRASDLTRAVNEALRKPTKTQGNVESATSLASEKYAQAIAAASSALFGTEQNAAESATSVASEKFAQAVTAASNAIYGTPTSAIYAAQAQASSRYNEAVSLANEQFSNAKSRLSVLVSGTPKPAHETMLSMIEQAYSDSLAAASERLQAAAQITESVKSYAAGPTQGYFESVSSIASSRLSEGISAASAQFTAQPTPALEGARRQYYEALGLAHARYSEFVDAASSAFYGPEQGHIESLASVASKSAQSIASQVSSTVIGSETPLAQFVASEASKSAKIAASKASGAAENIASQVSSGVVGTETPWTESIASQASQNWESLIAQASNQVYGAPTPWVNSAYSQAGAYAAQATAQAAAQYSSVQALISELVVGKEPDFTESVMQRFSSAYYTGLPAAASSVNSYASENYDSVSSYASEAYASASSVISSVFTPPPAIETILSQANEQLNAAVESASVAVYGTQKGTVEQASESIASAYSSVQAKASSAIYGTQQVQDNFLAVASSAQAAISEAIYGTPTASGYVAAAASGAASARRSISSVASEKAASAASAVSSAVSSAMYGPEQGAMESASSRLAAAVEVANSKIAEIYASASKNAEGAATQVSSAAAAATQRVKDEL